MLMINRKNTIGFWPLRPIHIYEKETQTNIRFFETQDFIIEK